MKIRKVGNVEGKEERGGMEEEQRMGRGRGREGGGKREDGEEGELGPSVQSIPSPAWAHAYLTSSVASAQQQRLQTQYMFVG